MECCLLDQLLKSQVNQRDVDAVEFVNALKGSTECARVN